MQKLQNLNPLHERFGSLSLVAVGAVALLLGLLLRSDLFLSIVGVVLEITGWVGVIGGVVVAAAGVAAYGHERGWWNGIIAANAQSGVRMPLVRGLSGSVAFLLVLVFFLLPWMSVSCYGEEMFTASGTDILGITQVDDVPSDVTDGDYGMGDALTSEAALLYVAALLALVGGALFFLPGRQGSVIRAGVAGGGILCLLAFVILVLTSVASDLGVSLGELEEAGVGISWKVGFWLSLVAFIAAVTVQFVPLPFADAPADES